MGIQHAHKLSKYSNIITSAVILLGGLFAMSSNIQQQEASAGQNNTAEMQTRSNGAQNIVLVHGG